MSDKNVVHVRAQRDFRQALECEPEGTLLVLNERGVYVIPVAHRDTPFPEVVVRDEWEASPLSRHGLHFASHPVRAARLTIQSGERHMLRCAIPVDKTVIMNGGNSVKAPWADVVEEVEFDWRQVP